MVFHGSRLSFHGFSWFFMVPGWFFMVFNGSRLFFHGFRLVFMVFLQNVPPQTVSWPNNSVLIRRPEGGIGPSYHKRMLSLYHHI